MGCGNPITNAQFYEDELFLAALPSPDRLAPPSEVRLARVGDSRLLAEAVEQSAHLETLMTLPALSGQALRETPTIERSETRRAWDPVETATIIEGDVVSWWVRGSVILPPGLNIATWTIEVSTTADGPWAPVGTGARDPSGTAEFTWDVFTHTQLLAVDSSIGVIEVSVTDATDDTPREVAVEEQVQVQLPFSWHGIHEGLIIWIGDIDLVGDGVRIPGAAQVHHVEDFGGYGFGTVLRETGDVPFQSCWDAQGNLLWHLGGALDTFGAASDCIISE